MDKKQHSKEKQTKQKLLKMDDKEIEVLLHSHSPANRVRDTAGTLPESRDGAQLNSETQILLCVSYTMKV